MSTPGEQVFLDERGITVTKQRFVTPGQTFAMSGITSVRTVTVEPNRIPAILLCGLGVPLLCLYGIGIIVIAAAIFWMVSLKTAYVVILASASGDSNAYSSDDQQFVRRVAQAINDAIIARG